MTTIDRGRAEVVNELFRRESFRNLLSMLAFQLSVQKNRNVSTSRTQKVSKDLQKGHVCGGRTGTLQGVVARLQ